MINVRDDNPVAQQVFTSASGREYPIDDPTSLYALLAMNNPDIIDDVVELYESYPEDDKMRASIEKLITKKPKIELDDLYKKLGIEDYVKFFNTQSPAQQREAYKQQELETRKRQAIDEFMRSAEADVAVGKEPAQDMRDNPYYMVAYIGAYREAMRVLQSLTGTDSRTALLEALPTATIKKDNTRAQADLILKSEGYPGQYFSDEESTLDLNALMNDIVVPEDVGTQATHLPLLKNATGLLPENKTSVDYAPNKWYNYKDELKDRQGGHAPPPGYSAGKMDPESQRNLLLYALMNKAHDENIVASRFKGREVKKHKRGTHGPWHVYMHEGYLDPEDDVVIKTQPVLKPEDFDKQRARFKDTATLDPLEIDDLDVRRTYKDDLAAYNNILNMINETLPEEVANHSGSPEKVFNFMLNDYSRYPEKITDMYNMDAETAKPLLEAIDSFLSGGALSLADKAEGYLNLGITPPWALNGVHSGIIDDVMSSNLNGASGVVNLNFADKKITPAMARVIAARNDVNVNDIKKFAEGAATGKRPSDSMLKAIRGVM